MTGVMDDPQPLRTIVADDDPLVRRLIRDTLQLDGVTVIAEASTGREAVELALFYRPDVVVMDYMMPEMDGIEATRRIYEQAPTSASCMLTGAADDDARPARPARRRRGLPVQGHGARLAPARPARRARRRGRDLAPAGDAASSSTTAARRPRGMGLRPVR